MTRLLVVNGGSSSTKCSVLDADDTVLVRVDLPPPTDASVARSIDGLLERFAPGASVHRIVHGGARLRHAVVVDRSVEADLAALGDLAPLHNPPGLALLDAVRERAPDLPAVACFDTAYFAELPDETSTYAVPLEWRTRFGVRRYGFHGLSHAWVARRTVELIGTTSDGLRIVSAHLGSGCSLAAIRDGRALDTTMGYTPLEGLVMATRCGSVDPGALVVVLRRGGLSPEALEDALERRSGLQALAGTPDLATVIERAERAEHVAAVAYGVYLHRLAGAVAAMAAATDGLDVLAFTGGAGEGSATLRAETCRRLRFLGLRVDEERNGGSGDRVVSPSGTERKAPAVVVVEAREDLEMARQARAVLGG